MTYIKAPIIEAIFDIKIDLLHNNSIEKIEEIHSEIIEKFPNKKRQIDFIGKIEFKDNIQISNETDSKIIGVLFSNENNSRQAQFRVDGFTFNMLKPYTKWEDFSSEALFLWELYSKNLKPQSIVRIALRYINKIEIPISFTNFQDYISNMPPIPDCLPQTFNNFFMQTEIPCDSKGTNIIITETFEKPNNVNLPFILDIDTYKSGTIINNEIDSLKNEFENLREIKNKTFENCITDKTRNLFN